MRWLAKFEAKTSGAAIGAHTKRASVNRELLEDELLFGVFRQLRQHASAEAEGILDQAKTALRQDEINIELTSRLKSLAVAGQRILNPPLPPDDGLHRKVINAKTETAQGSVAISALVRNLADLVSAEQTKNAEGLELSLTWKLTRKE